MKMTSISAIAVTAVLGLASVPALAKPAPAPTPTPPPACALTDVTPNAIDCRGFFDGQVLDGASTTLAEAQLLSMGLSIDIDPILGTLPQWSGLGGAHSIPDSLMVYGITYIGMHFGGGQGSPKGPGEGGASAFYKLDAGLNGFDLKTLTWTYNSSSDLIVYGTGTPPPPVPEAATWAMLIAGMGAVGFSMRRRKTAVSFA